MSCPGRSVTNLIRLSGLSNAFKIVFTTSKLVRSFVHLRCKLPRLPVTISRCSNNYGPYHFPEKLIPLMISRALADEELPVYGTGENVRDWLHVSDHCEAIDLIIHKGKVGEVYK